MLMSLWTGLPLLLVAIAAGCLSPATAPCADAECREPLPLIAPDVPALAATFAGCEGGFANIQAPWDTVRARVPDDFDLLGYTAATAILVARVSDCDRVVAGTEVVDDVSFAVVSAAVIPVEPSWRGTGSDYFLFDAFVSDARLADAFSPLFVEASVTRAPTRVGGTTIEPWSAVSDDCALRLTLARRETSDAPQTNSFRTWIGDGPFQRLQAREQYEFQGDEGGGVLEAAGTCDTATAAGRLSAYAARAYSLAGSWTFLAEEFVTEEGDP